MTDRRKIIENIIRCPICSEALFVTHDGKSALCRGVGRHCFDFSKDGYLSLVSQGGGGDSKEAVTARRRFLEKDYYLEQADAICQTVKKYIPPSSVIIDAGCGEGYYTSKLVKCADQVIGFDLSKFACAAAAKYAKKEGICNLLYATASVFELPVKDGGADAIVNIFAPCAEEEYMRALKDGGYCFIVGAGREHLMGLKELLYDNVYENGERRDLPTRMEHVERLICTREITVQGREDIEALFSMTPYYWRTSISDKAKLEAVDTLTTTVEFEINVYKK